MIGRWHDVGRRAGVAIFDTDDAMALQSYLGQWSPHLEISAAAVAAAQPPQ
jgi:Domain of unknown function (DUF3303)